MRDTRNSHPKPLNSRAMRKTAFRIATLVLEKNYTCLKGLLQDIPQLTQDEIDGIDLHLQQIIATLKAQGH